ncbi:MAG: hypothetical protein IJ685_04405 [Selenomonadaceae bacterium]|nr:hypothetical protein [Selenomonadaceae bacterium]
MPKIFSFDLQRFGGGKGGTMVTQTYEPTQYELTLQMVEATYAVAIQPAAIDLNAKAYDLLINSGGAIPVQYDSLYDDADQKIEAGLKYLINMMTDFGDNQPPVWGSYVNSVENFNQNYIDEVLGYNKLYLYGTNDLFSWMNDVPRELYNELRTLKDGLLTATQTIVEAYAKACEDLNTELGKLPEHYRNAQSDNCNQLAAIDSTVDDKAVTNYKDIDATCAMSITHGGDLFMTDAEQKILAQVEELKREINELRAIILGTRTVSATEAAKNFCQTAFQRIRQT